MEPDPIFYWHIHHEVVVEPLTEPVENRITFIHENKPKEEVETRVRLMKRVQGKLPPEVIEAWQAYDKAGRAYDKAGRACVEAWQAYDETRRACAEARQACVEAWQAYDEALATHRAEIEALHKQECPDCPWDGHTIFPGLVV